jgi:CelD/BcsL family acetyltransferase involved in cellulose biosynthesis
VNVRFMSGRTTLQQLGSALDDLHAATEVPITGRRTWLQVWADCHDTHEPWAFVVDGPGGRLEAAALLAARRRAGLLDIVALGHGPSDYACLPARTPDAARTLASGMAHALKRSAWSWRLRLEQLPLHDAMTTELAAILPNAVTVAGDNAPRIRFGHAREIEGYLSRNSRSMLANRINRLAKAGITPTFAHLRDRQEVEGVLADLEVVRRKRDAALLRLCDLDQPEAACFWRNIIVVLAGRGEAEVTTLRFGDQLAAYCVCFLDGSVSRYWDGRFLPGWDRFSPGALVLQAAVKRALADPRFDEFDWMRGEERFKQSASNDVIGTQRLLAWSSVATRTITEAPGRAKMVLKDFKDRHETLQRAWRAGKALRISRASRS